jgi:PhnB protein
MSVICYLNFDENAREALSFYQHVFQTKDPHILTYGEYKDDPDYQAPEQIKHLIMHAEMEIFGSKVMFSDTPRGFDFHFIQGNNVSISVLSNDKDKMKTSWDLLKEGGKVITDLSEQPFVSYYGYLVDRLGVYWQFISET